MSSRLEGKIAGVGVETSIHGVYRGYQLVHEQKQVVMVYSGPERGRERKWSFWAGESSRGEGSLVCEYAGGSMGGPKSILA